MRNLGSIIKFFKSLGISDLILPFLVVLLVFQMDLIYPFLIMLFFVVVIRLINELLVDRLRKQGRYPQKGKESLQDVGKLLNQGKDALALKCYRAINRNIGIKEAKEGILKIKSKLLHKS